MVYVSRALWYTRMLNSETRSGSAPHVRQRPEIQEIHTAGREVSELV